MHFNDWIYQEVIALAEEHANIHDELKFARAQRLAAASVLGVLAAAFLCLAFASSTAYWQSVFIELASSAGFFVAVPAFFSLKAGATKTKVVRTLLLLAGACLLGAGYVEGFWQSILIEAGVTFISVAALDLVIQLWMNNLKDKIRELEGQLAEARSRLP